MGEGREKEGIRNPVTRPEFKPYQVGRGGGQGQLKDLTYNTAANREGILLATYVSLASLARRNWR